MSTTAVKSKTRRNPAALIGGLVVLAGAGYGLWYYSPMNEQSRYEKTSLVDLDRVILENPRNKKAVRTLALRLADKGDPVLAEPALRRAYDLDPNDPAINTGLGELFQMTGRTPESFQILKATVENHPDYELARMALGRLYKGKGAYHHAATQFEEVIKRKKDLPDAHYELAICYLQMQKGADARKAIAEAIRQEPNEAHYLALKSSVDAVVGATDEGIETAKRAAQLAKNDSKVQINLINILLAHHRGPEDLGLAEQTITHLEKIDPGLRIIPFQKGELERRRGNWFVAQKHLAEAIKRAPYLDEAYFSLNQVYLRLGRKKEAAEIEKYYRRRQYLRQEINAVGLSLSEKPNDVSLHIRLADLNLEAGERNTAIGTLQNALKIDPNSAEIQKRLQTLTAATSAGAPGTTPTDDHSGHDHSPGASHQ